MIELSALEEMFENIQVKYKWNIEEPLLWGYFFTHRHTDKLELAAKDLTQLGYHFVKIFMPNIPDGHPEYYILHVEREEIHSPQSLFLRNQKLEELAVSHGLDSYDGMDVGPIRS